MNNKTNYTPVLSERDRSLFRDLIESRVMTLTQISQLHFGSYESAKKRLQQLKLVSYVSERKPKYSPLASSMLSLARAGFEQLADDPLVRAEKMSWDDLSSRLDFAETTLTHELEVVDMKVAFTKAIRAVASLTIEQFSTYPRRYQFDTEHLDRGKVFTLKPDGYARVCGANPNEHAFFFEWDRSTEIHQKLAVKAYGYQRFFESGAFALWNGATAEERDNYPFTPIFILPNDERRNNCAEHLLRVRHVRTGTRLARNAFLLTTHAEFLADPLAAIYITPAAYLAVTRGTAYDPDRHKTTMRVVERDRLVSEQIEKTLLFGGL